MNQVKDIDPRDAWDLLQARRDTVLIDVRSSVEFLFVGHAVGAVNVPLMDEPDWAINPRFCEQVHEILDRVTAGARTPATVLLICRSGKRSLQAGTMLAKAGFDDVYSVRGGFEGDLDGQHRRSSVNGWRFEDLPWEQC